VSEARTDDAVDHWPTRCPFCHDAIFAVRDDDWVACAACFARHHVECWGEGARCGSCGCERAMRLVEEVPAPRSKSVRAVAPVGEGRSMTLGVVGAVAWVGGFAASAVSGSTAPLFVAAIVVVLVAILGAIEERRFLRAARKP
jgi:outer membrane lipoprotein SlyB